MPRATTPDDLTAPDGAASSDGRPTGTRRRWWPLAAGAVSLAIVAAAVGTIITTGGLGRDGPSAPPPRSGPAAAGPPVGRHLDTPERGADGAVWPRAAGRPPGNPTAEDENRHALEVAAASPDWVPGLVASQRAVMADVALPWRYWLDPAVTAQVEEAVVHDALAAWDGIPGSRWTTEFAGYAAPQTDSGGTEAGRAVADGRSTVFLEDSCAGLTTANAYLFADGGLGVARYGTAISQIVEADIGVCPRAIEPDALRLALVHEVGHVVGFAHLCDPGDACWQEGMGTGPHGCRVMFWEARPCQDGLDDADRLALATTYPVLRPLWGPTPEEAMARASFALWDDGAAPGAVLVQPGVDTDVAAAAAVLAARMDGPVLEVRPDPQGCVFGQGAREVNRVLQRRGTLVLVGRWPEACAQLAVDWDVVLRTVPTGDPPAASRRMAELATVPGTQGAVVWTGSAAGPAPGDPAAGDPAAGDPAVVAAGMAAALGQPLLVAPAGDAALAGWLRQHGVTDVIVVGPGAPDVAAAVAVAAPSVVTLQGADPVGLALEAADLVGVRGRGAATGEAVVLVGTGAGVEGMAAVPVAARAGGVVLLSTGEVDPRVIEWLDATDPSAGWVVGARDLLPPATRMAYGAAVDG